MEQELQIRDLSLSKTDYMSQCYLDIAVMTRSGWGCFCLCLFLLSSVSIILLFAPGARGGIDLWFIVTCCVIFTTGFVFVIFNPRLYRSLAAKTVEQKYREGIFRDFSGFYHLTQDGLKVRSQDMTGHYAVGDLQRVKEDPLVFVLYFSHDRAVLLPKRFLPFDARPRLRRWARGAPFRIYP